MFLRTVGNFRFTDGILKSSNNFLQLKIFLKLLIFESNSFRLLKAFWLFTVKWRSKYLTFLHSCLFMPLILYILYLIYKLMLL